jgi:hypothetical protein
MSLLPPGQQLVAADKWPIMGERACAPCGGPWRVDVCGLVERPLSLSLDDLARMEVVERVVDIHCVTRWSKLGVRFSGVPLAAVVAAAGARPDARFVSFVARSGRGHSTSLELAEALRLGAVVALEAAGAPLPPEHGGPVRVVVPDRYFYKSLKWLARIELLRADRPGFWEATAGYHNAADPWREQRYVASGLAGREVRAVLAARDFRQRNLTGLAAAGRDLAGLRAQGAILRDATFDDCNLAGADFSGANLSNARLRRADLRGARFVGADVEGADFRGADLRGADFSAALLTAATFADDGGLCARFDAMTRLDQNASDALTPDQAEYVRRAVHGA